MPAAGSPRTAQCPAVHPTARCTRHFPQLPEQLATGPVEGIQRPGPDQPLQDLLGQAGPLDNVGEAPVRPAGQLAIEQRLMLLADPLDQTEPQPYAPTRGCRGDPAFAGRS